MNNHEIENELSALRVKRLSPFARTRILAAARAAWRETPAAQPVWGWTFWRWPAWTAIAASIMFTIHIIVADLDRAWTNDVLAASISFQKIEQTITFQASIATGRDPFALQPIVTAALVSPTMTRAPEWQDFFFKQLVLKQQIGLSRNGG